jgi:hypothetical protein
MMRPAAQLIHPVFRGRFRLVPQFQPALHLIRCYPDQGTSGEAETQLISPAAVQKSTDETSVLATPNQVGVTVVLFCGQIGSRRFRRPLACYVTKHPGLCEGSGIYGKRANHITAPWARFERLRVQRGPDDGSSSDQDIYQLRNQTHIGSMLTSLRHDVGIVKPEQYHV